VIQKVIREVNRKPEIGFLVLNRKLVQYIWQPVYEFIFFRLCHGNYIKNIKYQIKLIHTFV